MHANALAAPGLVAAVYTCAMFPEARPGRRSKPVAQPVEQDAAPGRGRHLSPQGRVLALHGHRLGGRQEHDAGRLVRLRLAALLVSPQHLVLGQAAPADRYSSRVSTAL